MRISDWSSDVCSSDLAIARWREKAGIRKGPLFRRVETHFDGSVAAIGTERLHPNSITLIYRDRKSVVSGKSVSVRVDLGGRRIIKKKRTTMIIYKFVSIETLKYKPDTSHKNNDKKTKLK